MTYAITMLLASRRDARRNNDYLVNQTYMILGVTFPDDPHPSKEQLRTLSTDQLIELQSSLMMYQHLLAQLRLLEMDYDERDRARQGYRSGFLGMVDVVVRNGGMDRASLIKKAPDWEIWATL